MTQTTDAGDAPTTRTVAFVFPGQGSQYVGMGADLVARSPAAAAAFDGADAALGIPLSRMILEGPAEELDPVSAIQSFYPMVEALARAVGNDPDSPPHLKKVTRTS